MRDRENKMQEYERGEKSETTKMREYDARSQKHEPILRKYDVTARFSGERDHENTMRARESSKRRRDIYIVHGAPY